jgi:hypothetical protein
VSTSPCYLKMEAKCSSETSVVLQQATRRYIPEDSTLHNHCFENLKSYIIFRLSEEKNSEFENVETLLSFLLTTNKTGSTIGLKVIHSHLQCSWS